MAHSLQIAHFYTALNNLQKNMINRIRRKQGGFYMFYHSSNAAFFQADIRIVVENKHIILNDLQNNFNDQHISSMFQDALERVTQHVGFMLIFNNPQLRDDPQHCIVNMLFDWKQLGDQLSNYYEDYMQQYCINTSMMTPPISPSPSSARLTI
jgi:hypothetical protein